MKGRLRVAAFLLALSLPFACRATPAGTEPSPSTPGLNPSVEPTLNPTEPGLPTPVRNPVTVVFHPDYLRVYSDEAAEPIAWENVYPASTWEQVWDVSSGEPAAAPGRMEAILEELQGSPYFIFSEPGPASEEDLRRVHTQGHIDFVKSQGVELYDVALLAVGGAVLASEVAMAGEVSFALVRPPGHHASPDSCRGGCYLNNIAVAVKKLLDEGRIESALIVDFDFHFGDGTVDIFRNDPRVTFFHLEEGDRIEQLQKLEAFLSQTEGYDILAVSAGFDGARKEWGEVFETQDYTAIGALLKKAADRNSGGKRFAVLEGGYNQTVLGKNVRAFLEGFR